MIRFLIAFIVTIVVGVTLWFSLQFVMHSLRVSTVSPSTSISNEWLSTHSIDTDGHAVFNLKNTPFSIISPLKNNIESVDKNGWTMVATTSDPSMYFMVMVHLSKNESNQNFRARSSEIGIKKAYIEQTLFDTDAKSADDFINQISRTMYPGNKLKSSGFQILLGPTFVQSGNKDGYIRLTEHTVTIDGTIKHFVYYQYEGIVEGYNTSAAFLIRFDNEQEYSHWKESYKKDFLVISKQILDIFQIKNE